MTKFWVVDSEYADYENDSGFAEQNNCDGGVMYIPLEASPISPLPGVWEPPEPTPEEIAAWEAAVLAQQEFDNQSVAMLAAMDQEGLVADPESGILGPIKWAFQLLAARYLWNPVQSPFYIEGYRPIVPRVPLLSGVATLDDDGNATVVHDLETIHYVPLLTPLGVPQPGLHALKEVDSGVNDFMIAGGVPNSRVAYLIQPWEE